MADKQIALEAYEKAVRDSHAATVRHDAARRAFDLAHAELVAASEAANNANMRRHEAQSELDRSIMVQSC